MCSMIKLYELLTNVRQTVTYMPAADPNLIFLR